MPVIFTPPPESRGSAFPDAQLGFMAEAFLGGDWTDITSYVQQPVTITRGKSDGQQQTGPTSVPMTWNNLDGRFSPRNPLSPYYGQLSRNTPVRISIPADSTFLHFATNDASYCSTPSSTGLTTAGDLDVRIDMNLQDSMPCHLVSKRNPSIGNQSWDIWTNADGTVSFTWWDSGGTGHTATSNVQVPLGRIALRFVLTLSSGVVTFYTSSFIGGSWTQIDQSSGVGTTTVAVTTSPVRIGGGDTVHGTPIGRVYAASILIGGVTKANPDFTSASPGGATVTDSLSNVWTNAGTAEFSNRDYRFHGECAALPQQWDREDVWTPVAAAGVLRRMNQGSAPLDSALKRGYMRLSGALTPIIYWPCEDGSSAQSIAAAVGNTPLQVNGAPGYAGNSDFVASNSIPTLNNSIWFAYVPSYSTGTDIIVRFLLSVPQAGDVDASRVIRVYTTGTVNLFTLTYHTGGNLEILGFDASGNTLFDSGLIAFGVDGTPMRLSMELRQSGGNINWSLTDVKPGATVGNGVTGTISGTVGRAKRIYVNPNGTLAQTAIGHISIQSTWDTLFDLTPQLNAFQGETAANRFHRLCGEENVTCRIYGAPSASAEMGAQAADTLVNLLQECETTDGGMMFEPLDTLGLGYRTYGSLCSQSPTVTLDYSLDHLAPPLTPTDDDQLTQNDVTVTRSTGSSARAVLNDSSAMSISPPPVGVGSYVASVNANPFLDSQLNNLANWLLHLGTVNEERYPSVVIDLTYRGMTTLFYPVIDTRLGDRFKVVNVPYFLPPDGIDGIAWGQTENLGDYVCNTTWQTQPASPYNVLIAGSGATSDCRADTSGSALHAGISSSATSLQVDTLTGNLPWTTIAGDFPFDILIGGERMTVTNVSGASSPQTFTVTRAVNGVVKGHSAGESVGLFTPVYVALA